MNDLDMDFLLGAEDDEGRARRRQKGSGKRGGGGRRRRRRRNRGGFIAPMLAIIILVGILGGGGYYGYLWLSDALVPDDFPTGQASGQVSIEIKDGQVAADVAQELERQGVVASAKAFTNAISNAGKSASLQPGTYTLRKHMAAADAVNLLDSGNKILTRVTIPEGKRLSDTIALLAKATGKPEKDFQAAAKDLKALELPSYARGLEGYAYPSTYDFQPKTTPADMLSQMVERYTQTAEQYGLKGNAKHGGYTSAQIVTIASIVQAEAGRAEDMPKIARVIYNRMALKPPMHLRMDSTVLYGLNKYGTKASNADLESKSRFNTYAFAGLPPGPIDNPGEHAIEAALNPEKGKWLYFIATDPKSNVTKFADTEAQYTVLLNELRANGG